MKKIAIIISILLFFGIFITVQAQKTKTIEIQTSAQCTMCKDRLEKNIIFEKGIKDVSLDMETKILSVRYKTKKNDANSIRNAIAKLGYDADEIKGDTEAYKKLPMCCKKPKDRKGKTMLMHN